MFCNWKRVEFIHGALSSISDTSHWHSQSITSCKNNNSNNKKYTKLFTIPKMYFVLLCKFLFLAKSRVISSRPIAVLNIYTFIYHMWPSHFPSRHPSTACECLHKSCQIAKFAVYLPDVLNVFPRKHLHFILCTRLINLTFASHCVTSTIS